MAKKIAPASSLDIDRLVREEVTEWFTSNRKGLETTFRKVADEVREDNDALWRERMEEVLAENTALREKVRAAEEEVKRMRSILAMVRSQVVEEAVNE